MSGRRHALALAAALSLGGCDTPAASVGAVTRIPPYTVVAERHGGDAGSSSHTLCLADGSSETLFSSRGDQAKVSFAPTDWQAANAHVEAIDGSDGALTSADVILATTPPRIANLFRQGHPVQPAQAYAYDFIATLARQARQQRQLTCPVFQPKAAAAENTPF